STNSTSALNTHSLGCLCVCSKCNPSLSSRPPDHEQRVCIPSPHPPPLVAVGHLSGRWWSSCTAVRLECGQVLSNFVWLILWKARNTFRSVLHSAKRANACNVNGCWRIYLPRKLTWSVSTASTLRRLPWGSGQHWVFSA